MDWDEFEDWGRKAAEWGAGYRKGVGDQPVRSRAKPGDTLKLLPPSAPEHGEDMAAIFEDFERIVMPGITHWQHPRFFAYFNSNAAPASVLAEWFASVVAPQCMLWQTSPAATEMETRMMDWLRQAIGLPDNYSGVIQDSASSATLAAVLTMRERALNWAGNTNGLSAHPRLRIYASDQVHTSIDRAIWVAGIGQDNLVKIPSLSAAPYPMDTNALSAAIAADRAAGHVPAGIIAATGGTSIGACDALEEITEIARREDLYTHLDAAWAGSAMICPEFRALWTGVEQYDSVVFNPHKWLGANFDCAAHFLRDPGLLRQTLAIRPEYLKTYGAEVTDYSEWSIPLGRRFRALKLWFLMRVYGLEDLRQRLRNHVEWSQDLCARFRANPDFEIVTDPILSLWTFRKAGADDALTQALVDAINDDGRIYLTQTNVKGRKAIRFTAGQFECTKEDFDIAHDVIVELAATI